ncbi:MAG TPA: formate/nitrite transporter family protein [Amycolatopsis sp.]|nr:formate/nitrite transporter family protein [Amycolatopsis sp.]
MYVDSIHALADQAVAKLTAQRQSLAAHLVRSMLAGMYVGAAIVLIFTIGGTVGKESPGAVRLLMGVCFGGALTIVIMAGSELFTGSNLVLTLGVLTRKARMSDLWSNWFWTYVGNLLGSALLAWMVIRTGLFDADPVYGFTQKLVATKMNLPAEQLFWRAVLANWLVCLGVWMNVRVKSEAARVLMIWWCMFTFITSGFEHSIANMCGLLLGLLVPHSADISWAGYAYNLGLATLGNVVGGAFFVAGMYWLGCPQAQEDAKAAKVAAEANGVPLAPELAGAPAGR